MIQVENERFCAFFMDSARLLGAQYAFINCPFEGFAIDSDLDRPIRLRGHRLTNSTVRGGRLVGAEVEDCLIDGIAVKSLPIIDGCLFTDVVIRGKVNKLLINATRLLLGYPERAEVEREIIESHYRNVTCALDIAGLDSPDFAIRGIPSSVIVRDPEIQAIVTYEAAKATDWSTIDLSGTSFGIAIKDLLRTKRQDRILNAARTGSTAERSQEVIAMLRRIGVAQ